MAFDVDTFVAACRTARDEADAPEHIAALLREVISDPASVASTIKRRLAAKPSASMADVFVSDEDLTIYHLSFPANVCSVPHDHAGWAVIGVYAGAEAFNIYQEQDGMLKRTGRRVLRSPAVEVLATDLIHDIDNPCGTSSGSIHVYSNRHFDHPGRRIWRDGHDQSEAFTAQRSLEYGLERMRRRRDDTSRPAASVLLARDAGKTRN